MKKWICLYLFLFISHLSAQKPELNIQREGHTAEVDLVCFSRDERQVLSGGRDNRLVLWDLGSKKFVRFIQADTTPVFLCFGPTGQTAVALLINNSLSAWSLVDNQLLWKVQTDSYQSLSQQGDSLIIVHKNKEKSCWDLTTGKNRWLRKFSEEQLTKHNPPPNLSKKISGLGEVRVNKIEYSKNGQLAVIALGVPPSFSSTTPGYFSKREGYGGLMVWSVKHDSLIFPIIDLPENVQSIAISNDGTRCLSASADRTVRFWDLSNGKELIRFEREHRIENKFTFSPDFHRVANSRLDGILKIFNLDQRNSLVSQTNYELNAFTFTGDSNNLLTANRNGSITRLSGVTLDTQLQFNADQHLEVINDMDFSANGEKIIVGSSDESRVMNLTLNTIKRKEIIQFIIDDKKDTIGFETAKGKTYGSLMHYYSSELQDDEMLSYQPNVDVISIWNSGNGQIEKVLFPFDKEGWVLQQEVSFSPNGLYVLRNVNDKWTAWNAFSGQTIINNKGIKHFNTIFFDNQGSHALTIIPKGQLMRWNLEKGEIEKIYGGFSELVTIAFNNTGSKLIALDKKGILRELDAQSGLVIRQIITSRDLKAVELKYTPDENFILLKSLMSTEIWDLNNGKPILSLDQGNNEAFIGEEFMDNHTCEQVSNFEFLPDGLTAVSATYGGTLKFWDFKSGKEICTLLLQGLNDWVVTTPSGLFDASKEAMKNMYFSMGTEIIELEQLKDRYFEPGLLQKLLGFAPGGLRTVDELNNVALYPKIKSAVIALDKLKVTLQVRNGGIGRVSLILNDKIELEKNVNPRYDPNFIVDLSRFEGYFFPDSINRLSLRAYNQEGWLKGQLYPISYYMPTGAKGPINDQPVSINSKKDAKLETIKLYALVVGTSNYRGTQLNLKYPDKDAIAFADAIRLAGKPLFGDSMEIKLLTTSSAPFPRKPDIAKALQEIASKSDPNDILLVYFSGHGITYPPNSEKGQFYYLTTDILGDKLEDPQILNTQAIAQDTLQEWIRKVKALKRILILDACNSGKVVQSMSPGEKALNSDQRRALERMNDRSGMFVLAGSASDKSSFEASRYGHGLLTYSLLNNMPFVAATNKSLIDIGKLFNTALEEVPRLAKEIDKVQQPELIATESFDIGIIYPNNKFPIPQALPVFVRTNFMDSQNNKDLQRLSKVVNTALDQMENGVFWDIDEFAGEHYYLGGLYKMTGNNINGKATLYQKDKALTSFPFSGTKAKLNILADQILDKAIDELNKLK